MPNPARPNETPATGGPSMSPEQQPDAVHDGAPGGPFFSEGELPSVAVNGGMPATLGGYSPDPSRTPQMPSGSDPRDSGTAPGKY